MYVVLLLLPILLSVLVRKKFARLGGFLITIVLSSVLMSSTVIATWWFFDFRLEKKIAVLDRDGDGFWNPEEEASWTEDEKRNMEVYIADGGRNVFAAIIFPIFSVVYSFMVVGVYWVVCVVRKLRKNA